jgi:hypothetical protein
VKLIDDDAALRRADATRMELLGDKWRSSAPTLSNWAYILPPPAAPQACSSDTGPVGTASYFIMQRRDTAVKVDTGLCTPAICYT